MEKIKLIHDEVGKTLTIWFDDPNLEHIAEETSDEVIHMKDKNGRIIGIEILNYDQLNQNYSFEHVRMTGT
jgi:uncharacterized protein YuzE